VDLTTPADEVYAFPVPFRPTQGQTVDFHFVVDKAGNVTVAVYDFAMNLVATPINNLYYDAGIYPSQGHQGNTWNGYNDKGDLVAVGVYYFKVVFESGETRWGKLAVIP
jgi:flagellar hook assembly protein FlgD